MVSAPGYCACPTCVHPRCELPGNLLLPMAAVRVGEEGVRAAPNISGEPKSLYIGNETLS